MYASKADVKAMLRSAWVAAASSTTPVKLHCATRGEAERLRFMLYAVLKGVKKSPASDPTLANAANLCVIAIEGGETLESGFWIIISRQMQSPFLQSIAEQLKTQGVAITPGQTIDQAVAGESVKRVLESLGDQRDSEGAGEPATTGAAPGTRPKNPYYTR